MAQKSRTRRLCISEIFRLIQTGKKLFDPVISHEEHYDEKGTIMLKEYYIVDSSILNYRYTCDNANKKPEQTSGFFVQSSKFKV